jgi:hypothetical protein
MSTNVGRYVQNRKVLPKEAAAKAAKKKISNTERQESSTLNAEAAGAK